MPGVTGGKNSGFFLIADGPQRTLIDDDHHDDLNSGGRDWSFAELTSKPKSKAKQSDKIIGSGRDDEVTAIVK